MSPLALLWLLALAAPAGPSTRVDNVEHIFGASNVNAVAGHGGLTAGISQEGDVTVLTWPGPSCCDQLQYLASNAPEARDLPHMGAKDGMGLVLGLAHGGVTTWLDDGSWTVTQSYADDRSLVPVTRFASDALDVEVTVTDAIDPEADVLQRRVHVARGPAAPPGPWALVTYANLSPTLSEVPELPIADWAMDIRNDFAAVWHAEAGAVIQLHPLDRGTMRTLADLLIAADVDYGPFDDALASGAGAPALAAGLDEAFGPGVYAALTTVPAPAEHQVGFDATDFCGLAREVADRIAALPAQGIPLPMPPEAANLLRCEDPLPALRAARGWVHAASDAFADAADGHLEGSDLAAGQVNAALLTPLPDDGEVSVRLAFDATSAGALAALAAEGSPAALEQRDLAAWHAYADALLVPNKVAAPDLGVAAEAVTRTARRALLHAAAGTSKATGAIVASIARQAPYGLDWPRDGAFFDYAFDVAGDPQRVTRRLRWAADLQRREPLTTATPLVDADPPFDPVTGQHDYPAGAWEMNYYADGENGGNIRFEIDNTALMVWSMAVHPAFLPEAERAAVAAELWPALAAGAELIAAWRDPATGLQAPASEDDNVAFTQSLHGAVTVLAGLEAAARLGRTLGKDAEAERWQARADELRQAILSRLYDPESGLFRAQDAIDGIINVGSVHNGDTAWLVWPGELLPFDDARVTRQLRADLEAALAVLRGEGEGGQYLAKVFLAGAVAVTHGGDSSLRPLVEEGVARLAGLVPTAQTQVYGEVYMNLGSAGAPRFEGRTSNPHLWEGALTYLAAMALEHPERFDPDRPFTAEAGGGGACAGGSSPASWLALALLVGVSRRRAARAARRDEARARNGSFR